MTRRVLQLAALLLVATVVGTPARAEIPLFDDLQVLRARRATLELDLTAARSILDGMGDESPAVALEKARLELYEGNFDSAAARLTRPDLLTMREASELLAIAKGAARATAATIVVSDNEAGVEVRLQDDEDRALVPFLVDAASRARALLAKDLGVELPKPLRIVMVRDQMSLSVMTGLPEEAAKTTGTVAVAKWGRVTMLTPRATSRGYPWLDTLVHELTHLALTRGTTDKAPLWLQEGVAKREETRWREAERWDDSPPADDVAKDGFARGLGLSIDRMGPSIAMLPSAEQAGIAYAEVSSFIRFWTREAGDEALPQLLLRIQASSGGMDDVSRAMSEISGADFATWDTRWRAYLGDLPMPSSPVGRSATGNVRDIARYHRLGELLFDRGHFGAAAIEQARAQALAKDEPMLRCALAASLLQAGQRADALLLVENEEDIASPFARWFSLHGYLQQDTHDPTPSFTRAIALDPLNPFVACEEKAPPELPESPLRRALCEAARKRP